MVLAVDTKNGGSRGRVNPRSLRACVCRKHPKSKAQPESRSAHAHVALRLIHASLHCFFILLHRRHRNRLLLANALRHPRSLRDLAAVANVSPAHTLAQFCEFSQLLFIQLLGVSPEDFRASLHIRQSEVQLEVESAQKRLDGECVLPRRQSPGPSSDWSHRSGCFAWCSPRPCSCWSCRSPPGIAAMSTGVFASPRACCRCRDWWPDCRSTTDLPQPSLPRQ